MMTTAITTPTKSSSLLNIENFLEEQAQEFANKFPTESFESPKASSYPFKTSYINKLL